MAIRRNFSGIPSPGFSGLRFFLSWPQNPKIPVQDLTSSDIVNEKKSLQVQNNTNQFRNSSFQIANNPRFNIGTFQILYRQRSKKNTKIPRNFIRIYFREMWFPTKSHLWSVFSDVVFTGNYLMKENPNPEIFKNSG